MPNLGSADRSIEQAERPAASRAGLRAARLAHRRVSGRAPAGAAIADGVESISVTQLRNGLDRDHRRGPTRAASLCRTPGQMIPRTALFLGNGGLRATRRGSARRSARRGRASGWTSALPAVEREALPDGTMRGNSFAALLAPPIREAATVFVNGHRIGAIWAPPYRVDVTAVLREGERHPYRGLQHGDQSARRRRTAARRRGGHQTLRTAFPAAGRRRSAADSVGNPDGAAPAQRAIASRSSAIASGASAGRSWSRPRH